MNMFGAMTPVRNDASERRSAQGAHIEKLASSRTETFSRVHAVNGTEQCDSHSR